MPIISAMVSNIVTKVLLNGLTIIVRPTHNVPKVSMQLWYNVGSKHEQTAERGLAHLLEHMIFKGTKKLSESDINRITHKLSATTNAFTSYDYTGYLFDAPTQNYPQFLEILADCMSNCPFEPESLKSEMKAVIQELKMYKDYYSRNLAQEIVGNIFADHPYHFPIIGFKQDLYAITQESLLKFYHKHYVPNNATLIVVGDVDPQEVFAYAQKYFGSIPANPDHKHMPLYHDADVSATNITLYRDVKQPIAHFAFVVSAASLDQDFKLGCLPYILTNGKSSRLHKLLVEDLQLASSVSSSSYDLFDYALFFITVQPKTSDNPQEVLHTIRQHIMNVLDSMAQKGFSDAEITSAVNRYKSSFIDTLENTNTQASIIGSGFLETGNPHFLFDMINYINNNLASELQALVKQYFRSCVMHSGAVLPLSDKDKEYALQLQKDEDKRDEVILNAVVRDSQELKAEQVKNISSNPAGAFEFPKAVKICLDNGAKLIYANNSGIPKISVIIDLKAKSWFDPEDKQGLYTLVCDMMKEGTTTYPASAYLELIESKGMDLSIHPGSVSLTMLKSDFKQGLMLLNELLINAQLPQNVFERIKNNLAAGLQRFWDNPTQFIGQLARQTVYAKNPYHKNAWGSLESLTHITHTDIAKAYSDFIVPQEACIVVVGDVDGYDVENCVKAAFKDWKGLALPTPVFTPLVAPKSTTVVRYPIARDQVVVAFCTPSITRFDDRYDSLRLYDQLLTGGALRSMHSKLFHLREQSGLFYTIGGSLLSHTDENQGMLFIKTIVSHDRLQEAQNKIQDVLARNMDVPQEELQQAVQALATDLTQQFESNAGIAQSLLAVERYNLPSNYFDTRISNLQKITAQKVMEDIKTILGQPLYIILAGRV